MQRKWQVFLYAALLLVVMTELLHLLGPAINNQINRLGKEHYYLRITQDGTLLETNSIQTKIYQYHVIAYSQSGDAQLLHFTADKKLKSDSLLRLYVKKNNEVTAWEEVALNALPEKLKMAV